jgi:hypothetical protein
LVLQGFCPVHQPPVVGPQGFDEGVEGVVLLPVPARLGVQLVEDAVPLPSPTLQLLLPADKERENAGQGERKRERNEREETTKSNEKPRTWKTRHAGPP